MGDLSQNFSAWEFECKCGCGLMNMEPHIIENLQEMRSEIGHGLTVRSGSRCLQHNRDEGGRDTSSHRVGLATDIETMNSRTRFQVIDKALKAGATRIGIGRDFVHVDWDENKSQQVAWLY